GIRDFHVTGVQTCALPIYAYRERLGHLPRLRSRGHVRGLRNLGGAAPADQYEAGERGDHQALHAGPTPVATPPTGSGTLPELLASLVGTNTVVVTPSLPSTPSRPSRPSRPSSPSRASSRSSSSSSSRSRSRRKSSRSQARS